MAKRKRRKSRSSVKAWSRHETRELLKQVRREDTDLGACLRKLARGACNMGRDLAQLAAFDADQHVSQDAFMLLFLAVKEHLLPEADRRRVAQAARSVLADAIKDRAVSDDRKFLLGPLYVLCGGEMSPQDESAMFDDYAGTADRMFKQISETMSDDPDSVEPCLAGMGILCQDVQALDLEAIKPAFLTAIEMSKSNPDAAMAQGCAMIAIAGEAGADEVMLVNMLERFAAGATERGAWCLSELGRWPALGAVADKAASLAEQLDAAGTAPKRPFLPVFSHGYVSMIDGIGSRSITLFFRTPQGGMDGFVLILNDHVGMKDAWCVFDDSSELEDIIGQRVNDLAYAPCTLQLARQLVADAWALHEHRGAPLPGRFFIYRIYLGDKPIGPESRTPDLGAYMLETVVPGPTMAAESESLVDYAPYGSLWIASDAAYDFMRVHGSKRGNRLAKTHLLPFINEIVAQEKDVLLTRLAVNLELEAIAGRATRKVNQTAAQTYLAIQQAVCPLNEIPYIQKLAAESAERIIGNLRNGYAHQQEANQAGLDLDHEMMMTMFDELTDDDDPR